MGSSSQPYFSPQGPGTQTTRPPVSELVGKLPEQYWQALTHPGPNFFAAMIERAEWRMVWVQLIGWAVIASLFGFLARLWSPVPNLLFGGGYLSPEARQSVTQAPGEAFGNLIGIPLGFFISMGLIYLIARLFGGQGSFLAQSYTSLLFVAPLGIISSVLGVIPFFGGLIAFAAFIYQIVLQIYDVMAVHRMSGGKATAVVLLPAAVVVLIVLTVAIAAVSVIGIVLLILGLAR